MQIARNRGFTVFEMFIVMGVLLVIISIVVSPFSAFRNRSVLNAEVENVLTLLGEARASTLSSKNDSGYGVHFESGRMVFFSGDVFTEPDPDNKEFVFDTTVYISDISLTGSGSNIVFNRLTGKTDEDGTITIALASASTTNNIVHVYPTGSMEIE